MIRHPEFVPGTVWLAGAGPGDPALLTLAALHAIETADVIVHDALVSPEILALAPSRRLRIAAGKRAGGARTPQWAIHEQLIAHARRGARVLRLKGGDPFVFGRGGEECLALAAAGIAFRVVPGISAGIGATSAALVPITHRGVARSVVFATGEAGPDGTDVDFRTLGRAADTLVLYMARRHLGRIAAMLIEGGRPVTDPVALMLDATTPRERVVHTTLGEAAGVARGLPPAATLVVIGAVAALGAMLAPPERAARRVGAL
ncbi:MAG: uroporphyrinogen-III C-methyltransferase [Gammaproteobacteria bacterium]|nr:uroporphyrinogen-III C-methyltransferase [Gammaproteobacteria bacterium]